jgi:hypothetical protein
MTNIQRIIIDEIPKINDVLPELNCGGCGFFALHLSKQLHKKKVKHKIIPLGYSYESGIPNAHIAIRINGILYDSTGVVKLGALNEFPAIRWATLCGMLRQRDKWNPWFPREQRVVIKRYLLRLFRSV